MVCEFLRSARELFQIKAVETRQRSLVQ
jgi:hypothetical protein